MLFSGVALSATPETAPLVDRKGQRRREKQGLNKIFGATIHTVVVAKKSEIAEDNGGPSREARDPTIEPIWKGSRGVTL